jgi:cytochrome P450
VNKFNLFDPLLWDNPFPAFAALRNSTPVLPIEQPGMDRKMFLVTSRSVAVDMLMKPELYSSRFYEVLAGGAAPNPEAAAIYKTGWPEVDVMLTTDAPEHSRFRTLVNNVFSPRRITAMQPKIEQAADELIDQFVERGECDFVEEFAVPLPIFMISDVLGISREHQRSFRRWSDAYILRNGQMGSQETEVAAARDIVECQHFLFDLVQKRRAAPEDDMISDLVHASVEGALPLTDVEILSVIQQILIAGNETTRSTLIGMMARLLDDPVQLQSLVEDPKLIPNGVEEALRFETPASCTWRIAREDVELSGVAIPKGSIVMARLESANRDESYFENPDTFDVRRTNARNHLSFGQGLHFCVGRVLARREMNIAMPKLLMRLQNLGMRRDKSDLRIHTSIHIRALRALHILFDPGPRIFAASGA